MLYVPRPYQEDTLSSLRYEYDKGHFRQLVISATGTGKTTMAMHLPKRFPELFDAHGMAFMVHRREIIYDTAAKFAAAYPDKTIGIEMGESHAIGTEDFIFFSVDSIGRVVSSRIDKYKRRFFGIFVTDEAHHAIPDSGYDNVLSYFGLGSEDETHFLLPNGSRPVNILLTATPDRADDVSLKPMIDVIAFRYDARDAVRDGYLVDIEANQVIPPFDIQNEEEAINYLMRVVQTNGPNHKTLLFAESVEQSLTLSESLNRHGIVKAGHVDANTPREEREAIVDAFQHGDLDLLTNRLVYTEGWDSPIITQIIDNANTKSRSLFGQKIGRGMRPSPDAQVDKYDTPLARRKAIANSSKPYLGYIATFIPTTHSMTPPKVLFNVNIQLKAKPIRVSEVVDVIKNIEEEMPDRPSEDIIREINESDLTYKRANIWTQTIYNEEFKALSELRWVNLDDGAAIYFPTNPKPSRDYDKVPTIYRFKQNGTGYDLIEIQTGGWLHKLKRPRKRTVAVVGKVRRLEDGIKRIDAFLRDKKPETYTIMRRGTNDEMTDSQRRYMDRHGIGYDSSMTRGVADILIESHRIHSHLEETEQ